MIKVKQIDETRLPPRAAEDSHWYTRDGTPMYEVRARNGRMRKATLADARKLDLVPSVTTILSIFVKEALERWKMRQVAYAAATTEQGDETTDEFIARVVEEAFEEVADAADLGKRTHAAISLYLTENMPCLDEEVLPFFGAFARWANGNIETMLFSERAFAVHGYGGKVDLGAILRDGTTAVIDTKTQRSKPGKAMVAWDGFGEQLAAYARGLGYDDARLLNVIISTTEPGRLEVIEHTSEREKLLEVFDAAFRVWTYRKRYDPTNTKGR